MRPSFSRLLLIPAVCFLLLHSLLASADAGHHRGRRRNLRDSRTGSLVGRITGLPAPDQVVISWRTTVRLSGHTQYGGGLASAADLRTGYAVEVWVQQSPSDGLVATGIHRRRELDSLLFTAHGRLEQLVPGVGFLLDDGQLYRVQGSTMMAGGLTGTDDLAVGQYLGVAGVRTGDGLFLVQRIMLEGHDLDGGYQMLDGVVAAVTESSLILADGPEVALSPETQIRGDADRRQQLEPGLTVRLRVVGTFPDRLLALVIWADAKRRPTIAGHDYEPFEALVIPTPGADPATIASDLSAEVVGVIPDLAVLLRWRRQLADDLLDEVAAHSKVVAVEPNYRFRDPESVRRRFVIIDRSISIDSFQDQKALTISQIEPPDQATSDGAGVVVAVIDTGVDPSHPVLQGRLLDGGLDLVDGDNEPWEIAQGIDEDGDGDIDEGVGHGTFVASLIALVAPGASILPYRVLDDDGGGTAFALAVALAEAISEQVEVINLSLTYRARSEVVDYLLELAADSGIVVVAAAGNDETGEIPFPASDSNVIGVTGLTTDGDALVSYGNRSVAIEVAAPAEAIYGAVPEQLFGSWEGTSFAAPFVTGVAARLRALAPELSVTLLEQAILQGGRPLQDDTWSGVALDAAGAAALLSN